MFSFRLGQFCAVAIRRGVSLRIARPAAVAILLVIGMSSATWVSAATRNWAVVGDGNWSVAGNWNPAGVPGAGDVALMRDTDGLSRTITYDYAGAAVTLNSLEIGLAGGTPADTETLSMSAHNLTTGFEIIGSNAFGNDSGTLDQSGGVNTLSALYVGLSSTDTGNYILRGSGSLVSSGAFAGGAGQYIGYNGTGNFTHSGGTNTVGGGGGFLDVGTFAGATGAYNLSGTGNLVANAPEYIGDIGTGYFYQTGGTNTVNGNNGFYLGYNAAGTGGTYTLSGGALTASFGEYIGYATTGAFNQSGGTNTVTANGFQLGSQLNSVGIYTLQGGTLSSTSANIVSVGLSGTGFFEHSGGALLLNSSGILEIGNGTTGVGTYDLSGTGAISVGGNGSEVVATFGTGTFNQSAGTNTITSTYTFGLAIGYSTGSTGTYNLSGGLVTTNNNVDLGFSGGTGVLNVSGTGTLTVGGTLIVFNPSSAINLSGGQINAAALNFNGTPSVFLAGWTGGTLNLTSNVTWDFTAAATSTGGTFGPSLILAANQTLMISANETLGGVGSFSLELGAGSTHFVTGTLTVSPTGVFTQDSGSTLYAATFVQAGGTVNGALQNQGTFNYQSGLFNGKLINQGTVNFVGNFVVGGGVENDASLTLAAGQTLTANGDGLSNFGTVVFTGGTVSGLGLVVNYEAGTIQGHGTINLGINNYGTVSVSGVAAFNGGVVNDGLIQGSGILTGGIVNEVDGTVSVAVGNSLAINGGWTNAGLIALQGSTARLSGGGITNAGAIQGLGLINSAIDNSGTVEALGGTLSLGGAVGNEVDGLFTAGAGSKILVTAGLATNAGIINLTGGTFDNNSHPLNNTGEISGWGIFRSGGIGLDNNGSITLSGGTTTVNGPVTNEAGQTITVAHNPAIFTGLVTNNGAATFTVTDATATFAGGFTNNGNSNFIKAGGGTLQVPAAPTLKNASSLSIDDTGTLRFAAVSGAATIGTGVTATVASGATLELAGSVSALSSATNRVNIVNNSSAAAGVLVSGTSQQVGGIDGTGTTQVNAGSDLTANHIVQGTLIIGGTANSAASVTIAPSDASGNPLAASNATSNGLLTSGLILPLDAGTADLLSSADLIRAGDVVSSESNPRLETPGNNSSTTAVPEPSAVRLALIGVGGLLVIARNRRRRWTRESSAGA